MRAGIGPTAGEPTQRPLHHLLFSTSGIDSSFLFVLQSVLARGHLVSLIQSAGCVLVACLFARQRDSPKTRSGKAGRQNTEGGGGGDGGVGGDVVQVQHERKNDENKRREEGEDRNRRERTHEKEFHFAFGAETAGGRLPATYGLPDRQDEDKCCMPNANISPPSPSPPHT